MLNDSTKHPFIYPSCTENRQRFLENNGWKCSLDINKFYLCITSLQFFNNFFVRMLFCSVPRIELPVQALLKTNDHFRKGIPHSTYAAFLALCYILLFCSRLYTSKGAIMGFKRSNSLVLCERMMLEYLVWQTYETTL